MALRLWAWVPLRYFLPVSTLDSCFAHTLKCSHASFTFPSLKYFFDIFNQTAAVKMWVSPFLGSWARQGALGMGRTIFHTFSLFSSSVVLAFLSSTGFKNPSGMLSCTSGQTAPFITDSKVALSVTFARALTLAQTSDRCSWAHAACLKISTMNAVSSACLACSSNCHKNCPVGKSSGGSTTLTPLPVRCCRKYIAVGSFMVLMMTSTSASPIAAHCLTTIFLKF